jgi:hypothetical protein
MKIRDYMRGLGVQDNIKMDLKERRCVGRTTFMAPKTVQWQVLLNTVTDLKFPQRVQNILTSQATNNWFLSNSVAWS